MNGKIIALRQNYKHHCQIVKDLVARAKKSYYLNKSVTAEIIKNNYLI